MKRSDIFDPGTYLFIFTEEKIVTLPTNEETRNTLTLYYDMYNWVTVDNSGYLEGTNDKDIRFVRT